MAAGDGEGMNASKELLDGLLMDDVWNGTGGLPTKYLHRRGCDQLANRGELVSSAKLVIIRSQTGQYHASTS